jgi:predicted ATP-grasp superfamily ATP-dependent carboligase
MRILILDANQNQAVASVRSLARAGHTVLAGEVTPWSKAGWSRSSHGRFQYPDPRQNSQEFVSRVAELAKVEHGTFIVPMTEATMLPLSAHRDLLHAAGARIELPSHADLLRAVDKNTTTALAESLGIRVPNTILISNSAQAEQSAHAVSYPVVLKPRTSEELDTNGVVRATGRPRYANSPAEFRNAYEDLSAHSSAVLVQEFIRGQGCGYFALMHHGELRAEFAHRRIRDVHPTGSGSAVRESVAVQTALREAGLSILRALNWHGVAMVEFRQQEGKPPVFIEVNGRFWHSLPLACYTGVDFPLLLAQMAEAGDVQPVTNYRYGIRCRWFLGDVRHLVEVWRGAPAGFPETYPGRWQTLADVFKPVPGTVHDLFRWSDPLPELADWINFLHQVRVKKHSQERVHAQGRYSHS